MLSENEKKQSLYYDNVAKIYDKHHAHPISMKYREIFAYKFLFDLISPSYTELVGIWDFHRKDF